MVFDVSKITGIGKYGSFSGAITANDSLSGPRPSLPSSRGSAAYPSLRSPLPGRQQPPDVPTKEHSPRQPENERTLYIVDDNAKVFLVVNKNTIEVRTDEKLKKLLVQKYESVMESRYFGRGGIEIVAAGKQLKREEIEDLVRLSYNLTKEIE